MISKCTGFNPYVVFTVHLDSGIGALAGVLRAVAAPGNPGRRLQLRLFLLLGGAVPHLGPGLSLHQHPDAPLGVT